MFKKGNILLALIFFSAISSFWGCSKDEEIMDVREIITTEVVINDVTISSNIPTNSESKVYQVIAWTDGGDSFYRRALLKFDLDFITDPSIIESATLSLYGTTDVWNDGHSNISGSNEAVVERISSNWDETTVTWENKPATSTSNKVILEASSVAGQDYLNIDLTALVKDLAGGENHGLMIKLNTEEHYRALMFHSMETDDATKQPKIVVKYKK